MRYLVSVLFALMLVVPGAAPAQDMPSEADRAAIIDVIQSQIAAFQADDGPLAYSYASPMLQRRFRSPRRFMAMVRRGYPPVYRPRDVRFLDLIPYRGGATQKVFLVGPNGVPVIAEFDMRKQPDGSWKINGCHLERGEYQPV